MPGTPENEDADYYDAKEPMRIRTIGEPHPYAMIHAAMGINPYVMITCSYTSDKQVEKQRSDKVFI